MSDNAGGRPPCNLEGRQEDLEKLAAMGCTQDEAAEFFDCSKRTLQRYLADSNDRSYHEAWHRGRIRIKQSLRRLQLKHASGTGNSAVQMTIHMSKHQLGESEKSLQVHMNPDGSPIDEKPRYVVVLPHNNRDPLPPEKIRKPEGESEADPW